MNVGMSTETVQYKLYVHSELFLSLYYVKFFTLLAVFIII